MKAKKGFNLRTVCKEQVIVAEGKENIDFSSIISMNESSAYLWRNVQQRDSFTEEDLKELLTAEYDVDDATALADATELAKQWLEAGIIEP
ncbi:MAG: PqqD family protein [Prevotella sp.]|nr:PqqD family protein [Prevotella sp.]